MMRNESLERSAWVGGKGGRGTLPDRSKGRKPCKVYKGKRVVKGKGEQNRVRGKNGRNAVGGGAVRVRGGRGE